MSEPAISHELLERVAALVGLALPSEDLDLLQGVLTNQLASSGALLALELDDVEPIVTFDPRWR
jgi:hypothetical protein